jgi:hypothetical protein
MAVARRSRGGRLGENVHGFWAAVNVLNKKLRLVTALLLW